MPDRWRVLLTPRSFFEGGPDAAALLEEAGVAFEPSPADRPLKDDELAQLLGEFDGLIVGLDSVGSQALTAGHPRLKVVARNGVGVDRIDLETATRLGIVVTNAPGVNTEAVADLVFGLIIALARGLVDADRMVRRGEWGRSAGREIYGKCLGLVGFGRIGQAVARRARGFAMRVLAADPAGDPAAAADLGVTLLPLERVLEEGDFVSLHVPLTIQTRHLIGEAELRRMKPEAHVINTARGGIVDEAALVRALRERWIAGAACDVFEQEPPAGSPLLEAPRLLCTPHIGAHTLEAAGRGARVAVENLLAVLRGQRPPDVVNPEVYRILAKER